METLSFLLVSAVCWSVVTSAPTCSKAEFKCDNGFCVTRDFLCDFEDDCGDWSDERGCQSSTCSSSEFECVSSTHCIPKRYQCDGNADCSDGSDEDDCPEQVLSKAKATAAPLTCNASEWMCADQTTCIDRKWICDAAEECGDGSDEANCAACTDPGHPRKGTRLNDDMGHGEFVFFSCKVGYELKDVVAIQCLNGRWSHKTPDCTAINCGDPGTPRNGTKGRVVGAFDYKGYVQYSCNKGFVLEGEAIITCEANQRWSDRVPVCRAPQAPTCSPTQFTCNNGACVDASLKCNTKDDCGDNSDEAGCVTGCPAAEFTCTNGRCVTAGVKCDGFNDCGDSSDERGCSV